MGFCVWCRLVNFAVIEVAGATDRVSAELST